MNESDELINKKLDLILQKVINIEEKQSLRINDTKKQQCELIKEKLEENSVISSNGISDLFNFTYAEYTYRLIKTFSKLYPKICKLINGKKGKNPNIILNKKSNIYLALNYLYSNCPKINDYFSLKTIEMQFNFKSNDLTVFKEILFHYLIDEWKCGEDNHIIVRKKIISEVF
ncbi:MAG: hypothetical protein WC393_01245 [Candidatus Nanoarchaeia archaeon]|jgi:hypothetical protein